MDILKVLLFPFAVLYDLVTRIRNHLYNIGQKRSFKFQTVVVSVGNLSMGGSGKTPMVEYLLRFLQPQYHLATLSRGYGRTSKGVRFADFGETASSLGDEPFQFAQKFGPAVKVVVGEERAVAIPEILHRYPETDVIVLDDAFQHRAVVPQLNILLTEYAHPFYRDFVLPMGRLRESRREAKRADVIVVTKCPENIQEHSLTLSAKSISIYAGSKPVFFSGIQYDTPRAFHEDHEFKNDVILVSGIASNKQFEKYASEHFNVLHHFKFRDHHSYSKGDLHMIMNYYKSRPERPVLLTTEKDMVRLIEFPVIDELPWFYLPIRIYFLKNGPDFDKIVFDAIELSRQAV